LLYNLGNCFCQAGDYPRALVCFERAHLLAPYDSEITENLNYVKRKLFQPETGKIRNPLDLVMNLRNQLRPDQWLAIAAGLWLLLGIGLALRQRYSKNKLIVLLVVVGFALSVALAAVVSQYLGDYRGNNAVVIGGMVKIYSLPSDSTAREIARVSGGTLVKISEKRIDWVRIRYDNTEGWVRCDDISSTSPGGKLPSLPWQKKAQP
jgi:tetratricopeptide (TPR) repeat protein